MIPLNRSLEHMAWSNQRIFQEFSKLPQEVLSLNAAEGEWRIGRLLIHLVGAGEWYRYILIGERWTELKSIRTYQELNSAAEYLMKLDTLMIEQSKLDDEIIEFQNENGLDKATRSMVLTQAAMHTAEHKGQIATILKSHGYHLDLDKYDLWSFESQ